MKKSVIAFMGSPRKNGNTDILLKEALRGAGDSGARTKIYYVNDLNIKGCQGCYTCRMNDKKNNQRCAINDDMIPIYSEIEEAYAIILGSPVYMGTMTAQLKSLFDRLFPYLTTEFESPLPKGKKCALIFTQNQPFIELFENYFKMTAAVLSFMDFTNPEILVSIDTIGHSGDPNRLAGAHSAEAIERKKKHRETEFPKDMQKAYEMGKRLVEE